MNVVGLLAGLTALISLTGCFVNNRPLRANLKPDVHIPNKSAILFFIDGVGNDTFDKRLAAGDLPNIKRDLLDRGLRYRRTVTCMPSITYAATATFLTGQSPGYHGIVGNRWFDPYSMQYREYGHMGTYRLARAGLHRPDDLRNPARPADLQHPGGHPSRCHPRDR